jgi:hypothetical protein
MKTTSYNTASEIRTGIILLVLATAIFAAFKVKELQVNETNGVELTNTSRIEATGTSYSSSPVLDAKLIEVPVPEVKALMSNVEYNAQKYAEAEIDLEAQNWMNTNGIAIDIEPLPGIESMINSLKYDAKEFVDQEMEAETQSWMNNSTYRNTEVN